MEEGIRRRAAPHGRGTFGRSPAPRLNRGRTCRNFYAAAGSSRGLPATIEETADCHGSPIVRRKGGRGQWLHGLGRGSRRVQVQPGLRRGRPGVRVKPVEEACRKGKCSLGSTLELIPSNIFIILLDFYRENMPIPFQIPSEET